jgi:hypothetical protein
MAKNLAIPFEVRHTVNAALVITRDEKPRFNEDRGLRRPPAALQAWAAAR